MSGVIPSHLRVFALQRFMAAGMLATLLAAYVFAYLLYLFPSVPLFWQLSVPVNRMMEPVTVPLDGLGIGSPVVLMAILLCVSALPLFSAIKRSWLGTAIVGHVALAFGVIVVAGNTQRVFTSSLVASSDPGAAVFELGIGTFGMIATTVAMVGMCALNHVAFFRAARLR